MRDGGNGSIQLLEADPELGRGLDPRRVREMSPRLLARAVDIPRGPGNPGRTLMGGSNPIGLLVLEGLLVREATVGDHPSAELLGPGDLLRAWEDRDAEVLLPRSLRWSALTNARVAIIDHALAVRAAQWPEIFAQLVERAARRAERLVAVQAVGAPPRRAARREAGDRAPHPRRGPPAGAAVVPGRALGPGRARRRAGEPAPPA